MLEAVDLIAGDLDGRTAPYIILVVFLYSRVSKRLQEHDGKKYKTTVIKKSLEARKQATVRV